jgi:hypothetical protein
MRIYYANLQAIEQQTRQLDNEPCRHCRQSNHLMSHGFIRKKQVGAEPAAVGKRVFCSNRKQHTGCGRTVQLYVDSIVRYLHHAGCRVTAFVLALMAGMTIQCAYHCATGAASARNAHRWLHRLRARMSIYRSLSPRPALQDAAIAAAHRPGQASLRSTFQALLQRFGQPLCPAYQSQLQRSFL